MDTNKITTLRVKQNTRDRINEIRFNERYKSVDELINQLLDLYEKVNNTHVKQIEQKDLNTKLDL